MEISTICRRSCWRIFGCGHVQEKNGTKIQDPGSTGTIGTGDELSEHFCWMKQLLERSKRDNPVEI